MDSTQPATNRCPRCGAELPPDAADKPCTRCALASALAAAPNGETDLDATSDLGFFDIPAPGEKVAYFGDYELLNQIGEGGMGVVYRARQCSLKRLVALKMLLGGRHATEEYKRRFRQEAEAAAQLRHPNIVPLFEVGEYEGQPYLTMEFVGGADDGPAPTLAQMVKDRPLPPERAAQYVRTVAEAVHSAHEQGIIHRDLKPSNILVGTDGRPRVTDFGLAKQIGVSPDLTFSGQVLGTPGYWPPEQAAGKLSEIGRASDVYALGAVLYCLLTGKPPFHAATLADTLQQVLHQEPVSPRSLNASVPRDLETICLKCLAKEPLHRYSTALALAQDLGRWLGGEPILAHPVSSLHRARLWARRNPAVATLAAVLALSLAAGTGAVFWQWRVAVAANVALTDTNLRLEVESAESSLLSSSPPSTTTSSSAAGEAIARLATVIRQNPAHPVAIHRLVSAMSLRSVPIPVRPAMSDGLPVLNATLDLPGRYVIVGDGGPLVRLWPLAGNPAPAVRITAPTNIQNGFLSQDGSKLFIPTIGGPACLFDARNGNEIRRFDLPAGLSFAAMSSDANWIALGGSDGTVVTLPTAAPTRTNHLPNHASAVTWADFSGDCGTLLTDSADSTCLWDVHNGFRPIARATHTNAFAPVLINYNGRRVAAVGNPYSLALWNVGETPSTFEPLTNVFEPICAQFSQDGTRLAAGGMRGEVGVWNADTAELMLKFQAHNRTTFALMFSPDGLRLASGSRDGTARIWNATTGDPLCGTIQHQGFVTCAQFTPDGTRLLTGGFDGRVRVHDARPGQEQPFPIGRPQTLSRYAYTTAGDEIVALNKDGSVQIWDPDSLQIRRTAVPPCADVVRAFFHTNSTQIAVQDSRHRLWLLDVVRGQAQAAQPQLDRVVSASAFSRDGRLLAVAMGPRIVIFNADTGNQVGPAMTGESDTPYRSADVYALAFSPDASRLAVTGMEGLHIWDVSTGRVVAKFLNPQGEQSAEWSGDGSRLLTASQDGIARIWRSIGSSEPPLTLHHRFQDRPLASHGIGRASFSPDEKRIVTWAIDGSVSSWAADTGARLLNPFQFGGQVNSFGFAPDGTSILTLERGRSFRLWDLPTGLPLSEPYRFWRSSITALPDPESASPPPDNVYPPPRLYWGANNSWTRFLISNAEGDLCLWNREPLPLPCPDWLPALAEALVGRHIDEAGSVRDVPDSEFFRIKDSLLSRPASGPWDAWARWFLGDRSQRRLSWSSSRSMPDLITQLLALGGKNHLHAAALLAPSDPHVFIALARATLDETANPQRFVQADFLCKYALELTPNDSAIAQSAAEVQRLCRAQSAPPAQ